MVFENVLQKGIQEQTLLLPSAFSKFEGQLIM